MVYPMSLRAPNQKSSGKKMDSDPDSSSTTACVWWRNPQPSAASKQGESAQGRRKRERSEKLSQINCYEKNPLGSCGTFMNEKKGAEIFYASGKRNQMVVN